MQSDFLKFCQEIVQSMRHRLFHVLGITACASNTMGFLSNIIAHGWSQASAFFGFNTLVIYVAYYLGQKRDRKESMTLLMIICTTLVEFPVMCYLYGHSRTVFCIFAILVYVFFLRRPLRGIFLTISLIENSGALILRQLYPTHIVDEPSDTAFYTMLFSFIIVSLVSFTLLVIIQNMMDAQQEKIFQIGEQVEDVLSHDALTGAYNRQYMYRTFEGMAAQNRQIIASLLDIDDFKQINDTQGHVFGDDVLVTLANILMEKTKPNGTVFRFGGEEFLILSKDETESDVLRQLQDAGDALQKEFQSKNQLTVTFSGGVLTCSPQDDLGKVLKIIDARLYEAKNAGKNRIVHSGENLPSAPKRLNRLSPPV